MLELLSWPAPLQPLPTPPHPSGQVVKDPPPRLADKERWSLSFQDFVAQCLQKVGQCGGMGWERGLRPGLKQQRSTRMQSIQPAAPADAPEPVTHAPSCVQDPRTRPTARYLQQHKFVARDVAAGAIKALLPLVQQARTHMAEMALMAGIEAQQAAETPGAEDGTWRPASAAPTPTGYAPAYYGAPGGTVGAAQHQHQHQAAAGYQATVAAAGGAGHLLRASADGAFSPAASGEASGTVVVRQSVESSGGWGATVVSPAGGPPLATPQRRHVGENSGRVWGAGW